MSGTAWDSIFGKPQLSRAQRRQRDKLPEWRRFDRQQKKTRARARGGFGDGWETPREKRED